MPDVDIYLMLVLPKSAKMIEEDYPERCPCCYRKKIVILDWNIGFLNVIFSVEFRMKYFKDIEVLYEKIFFL